MNTRILLPVLLALCGTAFAPVTHAADYFCRVYAGDTWEKAPAYKGKEGHYKITAADASAAATDALARAKPNHTVALTSARCETAIATFGKTATAATTTAAAAPAAPAAAGERFVCLVYNADGEQIPPPAGKSEGPLWVVHAPNHTASNDVAVAMAKASHPEVDSAICERNANDF